MGDLSSVEHQYALVSNVCVCSLLGSHIHINKDTLQVLSTNNIGNRCVLGCLVVYHMVTNISAQVRQLRQSARSL